MPPKIGLQTCEHVLQECLPVCTIIFRVQGEDVADLCYADTDVDLRGCKLLQVAVLVLQMELAKVCMFLSAAAAPLICCALLHLLSPLPSFLPTCKLPPDTHQCARNFLAARRRWCMIYTSQLLCRAMPHCIVQRTKCYGLQFRRG